jgi:DNA-binding LytR/AlgR family response regulator
MNPTALIADDEPRLAEDLAVRLRLLWPQLEIIGIVGNGIAAAALIAERRPSIAFLDIRMPGIDGMQVARLSQSTRVVFVTAYDEYAVSAFEAAAADYLLKPISDARLAQCVTRLAQHSVPAVNVAALTALLERKAARPALEWLTIRLGETTRLVAVNEVLYFQSGEKYTHAVTTAERHVMRATLKELLQQLDVRQFAQIHRSIIVNLRAVDRIERDLLGRARVMLRDHAEALPLSRGFASRFNQT